MSSEMSSEVPLPRPSHVDPDVSTSVEQRENKTFTFSPHNPLQMLLPQSLTDTAEPAPGAGPQPSRTLKVFSLAFLAFIAVCGGPFGIEAAVRAAGVLPTLIGVIGLSLIWGMPQAFMTAELSTIYDTNGGYITWVSEGLGPWAGFINGVNSMASNLCDLPLYPVLFSDYVRQFAGFSSGGFAAWACKGFALALILVLNIFGMEVVALSSAGFTFLLLLPFALEPFLVSPNPSGWLTTAPSIQWNLFVSALLWSMQGWDSLGCIAGEVQDGGKTYPTSIAITLVLIVANYFVPVMTGIAVEPDISEWSDGFFVTIASRIGQWLGIWILISASIAVLGEFNAVMSTSSRALQRMASYRMLPNFLVKNMTKYATPIPSIVLQTIIVGCLMSFNFDELVVLDTFFNNMSLVLEIAAFIRLKYARPRMHRPFAVPYGKAGAWAISIPKFAVIAYATATLRPGWQLYVGLGVNGAAIVGGYFWSRWVANNPGPRLHVGTFADMVDPTTDDEDDGDGSQNEDAKSLNRRSDSSGDSSAMRSLTAGGDDQDDEDDDNGDGEDDDVRAATGLLRHAASRSTDQKPLVANLPNSNRRRKSASGRGQPPHHMHPVSVEMSSSERSSSLGSAGDRDRSAEARRLAAPSSAPRNGPGSGSLPLSSSSASAPNRPRAVLDGPTVPAMSSSNNGRDETAEDRDLLGYGSFRRTPREERPKSGR